MDAGSSSSAAESAAGGLSAPSDSLHGLKFGKKIYFEHVGGGASAGNGPSPGSSSALPSASSSPAPGRRGRGALQGGQPPRCQVEGCKVDLTGAKAYYCRHKVCGMHSKSPKVVVDGLEQRFCQQCSRFHLLPEFDEGKRSCRRRLAGHNERRRKPPLGSLASRYGRLSSSIHGNTNVGSYLNFNYPRSTERELCPTLKIGGRNLGGHSAAASARNLPSFWQGSTEAPSANVYAHGSHQYQGSASGTIFPTPPSECFPGVSSTSCALSLLSSQPWGTRNQPSADSFLTNKTAPMMDQSSHRTVSSNLISHSWSCPGQQEHGSSSNEIPHDLGLVQVAEPAGSQFSDELASSRRGSRQFSDLRQSRTYGSSNHMHWSL